MNSPEEYPPGDREEKPDQESVERLLTAAAPPSSPGPLPQGWIASLKASVRPAWEETLRPPRKLPVLGRGPRGWIVGGLLAATLLLALAVGLLWESPNGGSSRPNFVPGTIATIEVVRGPGECVGLTEGMPLTAGTTLRTCPGFGVAVWMAAGASLRLDAETEVRLLDAHRLALLRGSIYLDCNPDEVMETLEVVTPFGSLIDLGTQFLVTVGEADLTVRVRQGAVELRRDGTIHRARQGTVLRAHRDGTIQQQGSLAPMGPPWDWVLPLAPAFQLDGRSLGEFLRWIHRETGYTIQFSNPRLAAHANRILLHGKIDGLHPEEALEAVLPTTGLHYRVEDGRIQIWQSTPPLPHLKK